MFGELGNFGQMDWTSVGCLLLTTGFLINLTYSHISRERSVSGEVVG